jgi:hypothetical protein
MSGKTKGGPLSRKRKAVLAKAHVAKKKVVNESSDDDDDDDDEDEIVAKVVQEEGEDSVDEEEGEEQNEAANEDPTEQMILTKTKNMSTRVRGESTTTVFRAVKFLNTPQLMEKTLDKLCTKFNVTPDLKISWKLLYQKEMVYALNNKRNSVYQDMKPKIQGKSKNACGGT